MEPALASSSMEWPEDIKAIWQRRQDNGIAEPGETVADVAAMLLAFVETHEPTGMMTDNGMHLWQPKPVFDEIEQYANEGGGERAG